MLRNFIFCGAYIMYQEEMEFATTKFITHHKRNKYVRRTNEIETIGTTALLNSMDEIICGEDKIMEVYELQAKQEVNIWREFYYVLTDVRINSICAVVKK
jgi:hypothetical protein